MFFQFSCPQNQSQPKSNIIFYDNNVIAFKLFCWCHENSCFQIQQQGIIDTKGFIFQTKTEQRAKETIGIFEDEDDDFLIQATNEKVVDNNDQPMDEDNDSDLDTPMSRIKPLPDLDGK